MIYFKTVDHSNREKTQYLCGNSFLLTRRLKPRSDWNSAAVQLWLSQPADCLHPGSCFFTSCDLPQPVFWVRVQPSLQVSVERCIRAGMTRCPRAAAVMQHVLWHELLLLLLLFFPKTQGFLPWILSVSLKLQLVWKFSTYNETLLDFFFFNMFVWERIFVIELLGMFGKKLKVIWLTSYVRFYTRYVFVLGNSLVKASHQPFCTLEPPHG